MNRQMPDWVRWPIFILYLCLYLLWFSGYFEGQYTRDIELTDYAREVLK